MGRIENLDFIKQIGIKSTIANTDMGNNIYILNNGKKYKEFTEIYSKLSDSLNQEFKEELIKQAKYKRVKTISFPEIVITDSKKLYGIVGQYEPGTIIGNISQSINIELLITLIESLEKDIYSISEDGWVMEDVNDDNILINYQTETESSIKIIDTDFYVQRTLSDIEEVEKIYQNNLKKIFYALFYSIINNLHKSNIWTDSEIKIMYYSAIKGFIECSKLIKEIIFKLQNNAKKEINTLECLRKTLK